MNPVQITGDREVYEGEIATYWFDDGILVSLSKPPKRTVALIRSNVELVKRITGNKRVPLLIYLSKSKMPDKETREYSKEQLPVIYSAVAMVSKAGLAEFIMRLLFKWKPAAIPMKIFSNDTEAKAWLKQFV